MGKHEPLTKRQRETYRFIVEFIETNSMSPTIRDVGKHFGITTQAVVDHLKALERKGWVTRDRGLARSVKPIGPDVSKVTVRPRQRYWDMLEHIEHGRAVMWKDPAAACHHFCEAAKIGAELGKEGQGDG